MKKHNIKDLLTILILSILAGCGPTLPELDISGTIKGTIPIDGSKIQGEPYFIDYSEKGLVVGTTEKSGAAYTIRTYTIKNKNKISLIEETSSEERYANLFWDEQNEETMGAGTACIGACMAATPCGGTTDQYGLTLSKQLSDGAIFKFSCFTETERSQIGLGAQTMTRTATSNKESIIYKKGDTIIDANSLDLDPRGLEKFSWFIEHRSKFPWLAKVYYLENYDKLVFISAPSSNKRGAYLIDFDQLYQKDRKIKINEFPFTDIAILADKKVAFVLKGDNKNNQWAIEIVSNCKLFSE